MSDIDGAVKDWLKTSKGKKALKAIGVEQSTKALARKYATMLRNYLRETTERLTSDYGNEFLDHIDVRLYKDGETWCADVFFDEAAVTQDSLYPARYAPRYLPAIVNNPWKKGTNRKMFGKNRHGDVVHATNKYKNGDFKHFIQKAVSRFESEVGVNVKVQISPIFK